MRDVDRRAFADTAKTLKVWILVRATNPNSCRFIGDLSFIGKPFEIKAKTADHDVFGADGFKYEVGGLVVDPTLQKLRAAFSPGKLAKAVDIWRELVMERPPLGERKPSGPYAIIDDEKSRRYGCLTRDGRCIHGDFDLYDIVDEKNPTRNLGLVRTVEPSEGSSHSGIDTIPRHWTAVSRMINARIGKTMVYHGGDAQWIEYEKKKAGHSDDDVEAFGPGGEYVLLKGTRSIAAFYGNRFSNRKTMRQSY